MRSMLFLPLLGLTATAAAQPVLVHPDAVPAFGAYAVEARNYGVVPGIAQSGTGVLWDLSAAGYSIIGTTVDSVLDPVGTLYGAQHPTATHAVVLNGQYGYYHAEEDFVDDLGYHLSATVAQLYTDPARILEFPRAVDDSWSDATETATNTGTITVTVLAEGELRLDDRTITDAVLIRRAYTTGSTTSTSTTWFRRSDALRPLGNLLSNGSVIVRAPGELTTAIAERTGRDVIIVRYDVPGTAMLFSVPGTGGTTDWRIFDMSGRCMHATRTSNAQLALAVGAWPAGCYVVQAGNGDGVRAARFVVGD